MRNIPLHLAVQLLLSSYDLRQVSYPTIQNPLELVSLEVVHLILHLLLDVEDGFEKQRIVLGRKSVKLREEARCDETSIVKKSKKDVVAFVVVLELLFSLLLVVGEALHV